MYDKQIQIPAAGERDVHPDVEGEAFQVIRLNFDGAQDPAGNPRLVAQGGALDVRMTEGDPVTSPFDGLEVHNEAGRAAESVAILRIYEDASRAVRHKRKTIKQARTYARPKVRTYQQSAIIGSGGDETFFLVELGGARAERVEGVTVEIKDNNLSSGVKGTVHAILGYDEEFVEIQEGFPTVIQSGAYVRGGGAEKAEIRSKDVTVGVGETLKFTLLEEQLIAPEQFIDVRFEFRGDEGEAIDAVAKAASSIDQTSQFPPR
jgi:hypothetical protein